MDQENQNIPQEQVSISLQDLVVIANLIKVVADRGAIKAEEMTVIGGVYEKLVNFLNASGAVRSAESAAEQNQQGE